MVAVCLGGSQVHLGGEIKLIRERHAANVPTIQLALQIGRHVVIVNGDDFIIGVAGRAPDALYAVADKGGIPAANARGPRGGRNDNADLGSANDGKANPMQSGEGTRLDPAWLSGGLEVASQSPAGRLMGLRLRPMRPRRGVRQFAPVIEDVRD